MASSTFAHLPALQWRQTSADHEWGGTGRFSTDATLAQQESHRVVQPTGCQLGQSSFTHTIVPLPNIFKVVKMNAVPVARL